MQYTFKKLHITVPSGMFYAIKNKGKLPQIDSIMIELLKAYFKIDSEGNDLNEEQRS